MNNWIEEAEKRQKEKKIIYVQDSREESQVIKDNLLEIQPFVDKLNELLVRISNISPEERKPSLEVGYTHLEGDLRFEFFGSAIKLKEKRVALLFKKNVNFIYWRRIYLNVTDTVGLLKITLYEKATSQTNPNDIVMQKIKLLSKSEYCQESICYKMADWLTYRISTGDLKRYIPHIHQ